MSKYVGMACPVCQEKIRQEDTMVVCPICGAPYHKTCYDKAGECLFDQLHQEHKFYEPPREEREDGSADAQEELRCSRCGAVNPSSGVFCEICGTPLNSQFAQQAQQNGARSPYRNMAYDPFSSPFAGVDPESDIGGEKAKDIAVFVGENPAYYLPKFKLFAAKLGGLNFNWSAALLRPIYFLYRKMWGYALASFGIVFALNVPTVLRPVYYMLTSVDLAESTWFMILYSLCSFLSIAFMFLCGIFANKLYYRHTLKKIGQVRTAHAESEHQVLYQALAKKGGVSRAAVLYCCGTAILLSFICSYLLIFWGMQIPALTGAGGVAL